METLCAYRIDAINKRIPVTLILLLCLLSSAAQSRKVIRFEDRVATSYSGSSSGQILPKSQRSNCYAGNIILNYYVDNLPDSLILSMETAADYWKSKIHNKIPINISVDFQELEPEISMLCDIYYNETGDNTLCVSSLYKQSSDDVNDYAEDAIIVFNSEIDWNCSYDGNSVSKGTNMYSSMLRAIAISLGFGTTVADYGNNDLEFQEFSNKSRFDGLVFASDGTRLKDLDTNTEELSGFATGAYGNVYVLKEEPEYKMYAPSVYESGKSLIFLDNENSLMHHEIPLGEKRFQIDNITAELINRIGWGGINADTDNVQIKSNKIKADGIASAYSDYTFYYESDGTVTDPQWSYKLYDKSGNEIEITTSSNSTLTIPKIESTELYKTNANGDIIGLVSLSCKLNNVAVDANNFSIYLEQKPYIKAIHDLKIIRDGDHRHLTCTVEYLGAEKITATVEEDYVSLLRTFNIYEPYLAHICIPNIIYYNDAWLDILIKNDYGKVLETIELPGRMLAEPASMGNLINCREDVMADFLVFNSQGNFIGAFETMEEVVSRLPTGLYIVKSNAGTPKIQI